MIAKLSSNGAISRLAVYLGVVRLSALLGVFCLVTEGRSFWNVDWRILGARLGSKAVYNDSVTVNVCNMVGGVMQMHSRLCRFKW